MDEGPERKRRAWNCKAYIHWTCNWILVVAWSDLCFTHITGVSGVLPPGSAKCSRTEGLGKNPAENRCRITRIGLCRFKNGLRLGVTLIFSFPLFRLCAVHVLLIDFARAVAHSFLIERLSNRGKGKGCPHYAASQCVSLCVEGGSKSVTASLG
jgi:hypothetical protein